MFGFYFLVKIKAKTVQAHHMIAFDDVLFRNMIIDLPVLTAIQILDFLQVRNICAMDHIITIPNGGTNYLLFCEVSPNL